MMAGDHDVVSSNINSAGVPTTGYFFEGAEKLLEIWFGMSDDTLAEQKLSSSYDDSGSDPESDDRNSTGCSSDDELSVDGQSSSKHGHPDLRSIPR